MRLGAGISTSPAAADAAVEAAREAARPLQGEQADLAFLFMSAHHVDRAAEAVFALREELAPRSLAGCVAQGVLGRDLEVESRPAVAVWAGSLPGATVRSFRLEPDGSGLPSLEDPALVVLLVDPFTFPAGRFLQRLNEEAPGLAVVGGLAAGAGRPGTQAFVVDGELFADGAVAVAIGGVSVRTVVSQGCSPIGREMVITRAEGNVVYELAGERAIDRLRREVERLSPAERALVAQGILAGLVIDENKAEYGRGDFLVRGVLGADESSGAIVVGEQVRVGQTLRFHVRDAETADEDLRESLSREVGSARAAGALLFTCNGRGTHMFDEESHDARTVSELLGSPAVAGFFCGGEIGPVGGRAFLHGFTATLAVFAEG